MTNGLNDHDDESVHAALIRWGAVERSAAGDPSAAAAAAAVTDVSARRRTWLLPFVAAAAVVAIAGAAATVGDNGGSAAPGPAVGGATTTATIAPDLQLPTPTQFDGFLEITPAGPDDQPQLTREQAEVIMLNSWPPPPIRDNAADVPRATSSVSFTVARVRLDPDIMRVGDVPEDVPLAWVARWNEPDAPKECPPAPQQSRRSVDVTARPHAYVLAGDGSTAYHYTGPSTSCADHYQPDHGQRQRARAQRAVNRISVPWTGDTRDESGDVLMSFEKPTCAEANGVGDEQGSMIFIELPVGVTCTDSVVATIRTGPTEPKHHPLLGAVRTVNGRFLPALPVPQDR